MIKKLFSCIAYLLLATNALYASSITNGTVTLLTVDAKESKALMQGDKSIPLLPHPTDASKKIALIVAPYAHKNSIELLHVKTQGSEKIILPFLKGNYHEETLLVEPSKVSPPKELLPRIQAEAKEARELYAIQTPKRFWKSSFDIPLNTHVTSAYGNARVFNDTLQSYHSGVDFRAATGTPIGASNDGVVVLAKERYYAGGSVVIDHGEGIYSVYYHLDTLKSHVGKAVKKGDIIGLSGATGRVTGPHLHFGFMVRGVPIDPLDFIAKINTLF